MWLVVHQVPMVMAGGDKGENQGPNTKFGGEIMQGQISGTRREGQPCRWGQAGVPALPPTRRVTLGQAVGGAVLCSSARRTSLRGLGTG